MRGSAQALCMLFGLVAASQMALATVSTPSASMLRASDGRIIVNVSGGQTSATQRIAGYNVYRDGRYFTTLRPSTASGRFAFDGAGGDYCLVAFVDSVTSDRYSNCSTATLVSAGPPAPPSRVRASVYSPGVADIVWSPSPDHTALAGYEIRRNRVLIDFHKGRSQFESGLEPTRDHDYTVVAVDRQGRRSLPARFRLSSVVPPLATSRRSGRGPVGGVSTIEQPRSSVTNTSSSAAAAGSRRLSIAPITRRARLQEGEGEYRVPISVSRSSVSGTVTLTLDGYTDDDERYLSYRFEPAELGYGRTDATLILRLHVGMAPIDSHARQFNIGADDGRTHVRTRLVVDVEPTDAHDVYLLIGQSNMVGYSERGLKDMSSGGPDEPNSRIRQLNVRENSRRHFNEEDDFTDETANVRRFAYTRAEDPLHTSRSFEVNDKSSTYIGLGLTFAKSALARTTRNIFLVPAAWGATGFCANRMGELAWNTHAGAEPGLGGTLLLDRAMTRLDKTLRDTDGVLRGILWHQGGADSADTRCASAYAENIVNMVRYIRREARPDRRGASARGDEASIPFIVATMSKGIDSRGNYARWSASKRKVDAVHRSMTRLLPFADFVDNDDLVPPAYPCGQSSCVHFGADALREQGRRFDLALQRIVGRHGDSPSAKRQIGRRGDFDPRHAVTDDGSSFH